jgi:hypothetical protein
VISDDRNAYQISRLANYQILSSALLVGIFAAILVGLGSGLRPDAFFVGDPGIKLIAAKNAIAHPDRPLDIPLPVIGSDSLPHVEPFFEVHGDHAHAVTPDLFPLVSAPFIRWFGLRGAYVLPALGFLGILAGCAWLAVALDPRRNPALVVLIAALATPFLFYGLEFWEHAPAVALAANGTAMFVTGFRARRGAGPLAFAAGLAFGIAFLLRPEMICVLVAVLVAATTLERPREVRLKPDTANELPNGSLLAGLTLAGAALTLAPLEIYTVGHFSRIMPSHLWANSGLIQGHWLSERVHLALVWLLPSAWRLSGPVHPESFWTAAPLILVACVLIRSEVSPRGRRFLVVVTGLTMVLVFLTAPNDGGGQWAPRYLLFAYVPLVVLAADVVEALPRRPATIATLAILLLACLWIQRTAYRDLRGSKSTYGRVVDFVANEVAPNGYLVTDLWWLDQVAAAATAERRVIYIADAASGRAVMQRLSRAIVPIVVVFRSESESPDVSAWRDDTCYVEIKRETVDVRRLVAITLHHRCSQ